MTRFGCVLLVVLSSIHALLCVGCHTIRSTDTHYWDEYQKGFAHVEKACIGSAQGDQAGFEKLRREVVADADRLSAEFDALHYTLPPDHPLSKRAANALERVKPALRRRERCSTDQQFDLDGITTLVIAHDLPAAFSFPNGRIYLTTGLIDPEFPWAARSDDELLGVVAHETIHLSDWHVVVHWAVIREHEAETAWNAPLLLTWLTPMRLSRGPLPLEVETYDERIEFLADSGAVEVLIDLRRDPRAYQAYLNRMASYPYYSELKQAERKDLLYVRADCLARCLSPAAVEIRGAAGGLRPLTAQEQYVLCAETYLSLPKEDWAVVDRWLNQPDGVPLNELPAQLSQTGRRSLEDSVTRKSEAIEGAVRIARALLGERAQLANGCPSGRVAYGARGTTPR